MTQRDAWRAGSSSGSVGRWDRLFTDLESELEAADEAEFAAEVADRTRREFAAVRIVDRLRAALGAELSASMDAGSNVVVTGVLREVGPDWLLLADESDRAGLNRRLLLLLGAVTAFQGLPIAASAPGSEGHIAARYDVRMVLRRLVRDRAAAALTLRTGEVMHGVLDCVGADFLEVAPRELGETRHARSEHRLRTVPVAALAIVRLI